MRWENGEQKEERNLMGEKFLQYKMGKFNADGISKACFCFSLNVVFTYYINYFVWNHKRRVDEGLGRKINPNPWIKILKIFLESTSKSLRVMATELHRNHLKSCWNFVQNKLLVYVKFCRLNELKMSLIYDNMNIVFHSKFDAVNHTSNLLCSTLMYQLQKDFYNSICQLKPKKQINERQTFIL